MNRNSAKEKEQVKKLKYGQPARRIADEENPVELGEEEGSYARRKKTKK